MSAETVSVMPTPTIADSLVQKKNRIQVSNTKKPLFFYVNLAKVSLFHHLCFFFFLFFFISILSNHSELTLSICLHEMITLTCFCSPTLVAHDTSHIWMTALYLNEYLTNFSSPAFICSWSWVPPVCAFVDCCLCKCMQRYIQQHDEVELSALGMGIWSPPIFFSCIENMYKTKAFVFALFLRSCYKSRNF